MNILKRIFCSKKVYKEVWKPEYEALAMYNSEVMRGIVHTKEYVEKMRVIQDEYNRHYLKIETL